VWNNRHPFLYPFLLQNLLNWFWAQHSKKMREPTFLLRKRGLNGMRDTIVVKQGWSDRSTNWFSGGLNVIKKTREIMVASDLSRTHGDPTDLLCLHRTHATQLMRDVIISKRTGWRFWDFLCIAAALFLCLHVPTSAGMPWHVGTYQARTGDLTVRHGARAPCARAGRRA
jgi:hypothetical protein